MKPIYEIENQAFRGIRVVKGVVQYLGEFQLQHPTKDNPDAPSRHIMLEYGEMDLDEYLAETYPPVLNGEIRQYWAEVFTVATTFNRIQNLPYNSEHGNRQYYRGQFDTTKDRWLKYLMNTVQVARRHQTQ